MQVKYYIKKNRLKAGQSQHFWFPKRPPRNKNSKLFIGIYLNRKKNAEENDPFMVKMGSYYSLRMFLFQSLIEVFIRWINE